METIFAQIVADLWKVAPEDVVVVARRHRVDRDRVRHDGEPQHGHRCRRAMHHASERLRDKVFAIAANLLECAPADLELRDGGVGVVGVPGATVSLARIAQAARPGWDNERPPGVDAGLEETYYWQPPTVTWSYAVHVAIVEVDRETGRVGDRGLRGRP